MREIDLRKIKDGWYSAEYFNRARHILLEEKIDNTVIMQLFQKQDAMICGLQETITILKECAEPWEALTVHSLNDGDLVKPWETIMTIEGPLHSFIHLESVYLGVIRDSTTVATNMHKLKLAANNKEVIYLADRFNGFENQERQGYAAIVGGADGVCTHAGGSKVNSEVVGTMAHAFIAAYGGDLVEASKAFVKYYPQVNLVALVDFNNDCVTDALKVANVMGRDLKAVRLDTSEKMQDKCFWVDGQEIDDPSLYGVCPQLVKNVRTALNFNGFDWVKIVVSGGFNTDKIKAFEAQNIPVDVYGVGSSVLRGGSDITADVVWPVGKAGRTLNPNSKLHLVE